MYKRFCRQDIMLKFHLLYFKNFKLTFVFDNATHLTGMRFLSGMNPLVLNFLVRSVESTTAVLALIRFLMLTSLRRRYHRCRSRRRCCHRRRRRCRRCRYRRRRRYRRHCRRRRCHHCHCRIRRRCRRYYCLSGS